MNLIVQELNIKLQGINQLIENGKYDDAYDKFQEADNDIESGKYIFSTINTQDRESLSEFYSSYAYFLFSVSEFNQFFKMYIKAQRFGYSFEKRREFIFEAFVKPNLENFKANYMNNIENMKAAGCIDEWIEFEDLSYWLITTGVENEYYLYDKEMDLIQEKFTFDLDKDIGLDIDLYTNISDYILPSNGDWSEIQPQIKEISSKGKKSYIVTHEMERLLSYIQGGIINEFYLDRIIILKDINKLKSYFMNRNSYLPKALIGSDTERLEYSKALDEVYRYRLDKNNRSGDKVLLSICIPSYNRGKRAYDNVIHTLQSGFDEEIEIIVSNNGTKNESKDYYEKIKQIEDSRVTYFEFEENQGMALNICKVLELATGKYTLFLSDEDLIDLNKLQLIINILISNSDSIAITRVKSDKQGFIPFEGLFGRGQNALFNYMLTSNYISGNIYNRELLEEYKLREYIGKNLNNQACLYYPHMVWDLVVCQYGDVLGLDIVLVNEGKAEKTEFPIEGIGISEKKSIPYYATIEGRLGQHKGFFDVIKDLEISKSDFDIFRELYIKLCHKTFFLVSLSINAYYKQTDIDIDELLKAVYNESLKHLEELYQGKKNHNKYNEDKEKIKSHYEYYKVKNI